MNYYVTNPYAGSVYPEFLNKENTLFYPEGGMTTEQMHKTARPKDYHIVTDCHLLVSLYSGNEYLLESIEDGALCWWGNVSVNPYNQETVNKFPQWRWTDEQFAFSERWQRACKRRDAYMVLPMLPVFHDDGSVTLGCRLRYEGLPGREWRPQPKKFDNWKKLKVKDMLAYYDEASAEDKEKPKLKAS